MKEYITKFNGTENRFLSNFYPCSIIFNNKEYSTSEHAYQAAKTLNEDEREKIRLCESPAIAKKLGRQVALRPDWEEVKDCIMLDILRIKFNNVELKEKLLATGDKILVEGNFWHDNHFGVCSCDKCNGQGKNVLGQLLMQVRDELKNYVLNSSKIS